MSRDPARLYIRHVLDRTGLNATELARRAGVAHSTIHRALSPEQKVVVSRRTLVAIEAATGLGFEDFQAGRAPATVADAAFERIEVVDPRTVPEGGTLLDAGPPAMALAFPREWLASLANAPYPVVVGLRVLGDVMEPTLADGDLVLVDASATDLARGGLYALGGPGGAAVRRVSLGLDGRARVKPDNPAYDAVELDAGSLAVLGRVIWSGGRL